MSDRNGRTHRLIWLVAALKGGGCPGVRRLAAAAGRAGHSVCAKTVQRDIDTLRREFGAPIEFDSRGRGYRLTSSEWALPFVDLRGDDLFAALLCGKLSQAVLPEPWKGQAEAAMTAQLAAGEPEGVDLALLNALVAATGRQPALDQQVFETVTRAWKERRRLAVQYERRDGQVTEREIDVHALFLSDDAWYARVYCHLRGGVRSLALHRLRNPRLLDATFERSPMILNEVRSGRVFDYQWVWDIVLRGSAVKAKVLREREWFPGIQVRDLPDGEVELRIPQAPQEVLFRWILSFAGHLTVLAPAGLRHDVAAAAQRLLAGHT